ncbi:hypothetical protein LPJ66_005929, partial [Kickxella alabastrina]
MAKPEQATGHKLQQLPGFGTSSPFSQPPKSVHSSNNSASSSPTAPNGAQMSSLTTVTGRNILHERLPGPSSFIAAAAHNNSNNNNSSSSNRMAGPAYNGIPGGGSRRASGMPPEKTPVGRSGVFGDYGGGDQFYRRHSVDMGVSQHSVPRPRFQQHMPQPLQYSQHQLQYQHQPLHQQSLQYQQQSQQPPQHHVISPPTRYGSRAEAASPHPLSFNQTAGNLSPTGSGESGTMDSETHSMTNSRSRSPAEGSLKRSAPDDNDDDSPSPLLDNDDCPHGSGIATSDKPYACDQCELTFSRQHNLKSHALTHSTERPFSCPICQTPFRRQHDLKRHMKLHTGEKPHTCTNCGRSFARLDALNRHMRAENFHACNQAAKKARTAVAPKQYVDPRQKSVAAAFMEQRRASTTIVAGDAGWSHWSHRPSMAADEAMLRRMQAQFGVGPGHPQQQQKGKCYGADVASQSSVNPHSLIQQQQQQQRAYMSAGNVPQPPPPPHAKPWSSYNNTNTQPAQSVTATPTPPASSHLQQRPTSLSARPSRLPNGLLNSPSNLPPPPPPPAGSDHSTSRRFSPERNSGAAWQGAIPFAPTTATAAVGNSGLGINTGPGGGASSSAVLANSLRQNYISQQVPGTQAPLPPPMLTMHTQPLMLPPPTAVGNSSNSSGHGPLAQNIRLPPIEYGLLRRHSLAVTSHLERYRARDATPPLPLVEESTDAVEAAGEDPALDPAVMAKEMADGSRLPPPYHGGQAVSGGYGSGGRSAVQQQPLSQQMALHEERALPPLRGPGLGLGIAPAPLPVSFLNYSPSVRVNNGNSGSSGSISGGGTGLKSTLITAVEAAINNDDGMGEGSRSRRGSVYSNAAVVSANESFMDTRRSSIIALTNPQSEMDVRVENNELKRRLDEMEAKYLKEVERLNYVVRGLEAERNALRGGVTELHRGGGEMMEMSPPVGVHRVSAGAGLQSNAPLSSV